MSFDEKIMGGNKIENLPIILEEKLSLYVSIYYASLHRKYPPKSSFNDDGTSPEHIYCSHPNNTCNSTVCKVLVTAAAVVTIPGLLLPWFYFIMGL
jgi:hypothetical protein